MLQRYAYLPASYIIRALHLLLSFRDKLFYVKRALSACYDKTVVLCVGFQHRSRLSFAFAHFGFRYS